MAKREQPTTSAKKAGRKAGTFQPGDSRINRTIPGPGRPPDVFKQLCRDLASGALTIQAVTGILSDASHPQFMAALKWATEHGYGKPKESVEHQGTIQHEHRVMKWGNMEIPL